MATFDPNGWSAQLKALRSANDRFVLTIWNAVDGNEAGYKVWRTLDGEYANKEPGFLMNIPIHQLCEMLEQEIKEQPAISSGGSW